MWQKEQSHGFSSLATAQPNYLATIALDAGVQKARGKLVPQNITVPLPSITDSNLRSWVKDSQPDDYYPINVPSQAKIDAFIKKG